MKQGTIILMLLIQGVFADAQSFSEVYKKSFEMLAEHENISYDMTYLSKGATTTVNETVVKIEKIGDNHYTKIDQVESYLIDSTSIVIDHEYKTILLNEGIGGSMNLQLLDRMELIKGMEQEATRFIVDSSDSKINYTLFFKNQEFKKVVFVVNKKTGWFNKLVFMPTTPIENIKEMEEEPVVQVEIILNNYQTGKSSFTTSITDYLKYNKGRYALQPAYSTYQFTNNYDWR